MADYGIGIGAFAQGLSSGLSLGQKLKEAKKQYDVEQASSSALDAAKQAHADAVNAGVAKILGLGPSGPGGPSGAPAQSAPAAAPADSGSGVTTQPVDMSMPQATPLPPDQGGAPAAAAPAPAPQAPAVPPDATQGAPMASSGSMAPAPSPAQAVAAARALDAQASAGPIQKAAQPSSAQADTSLPAAPASAASAGLPSSASPMTQDQAQALAEKGAPSVMDFFRKQGVPKIAETYLAQGDAQKAQAWTDWAESAQSKENMGTWAKAWRAVQLGDVQSAGDNILKLYNNYDDGVTASNAKPVKDKDGNITGFNVNLKTDATGETRATFVDKNTLMNAGLASLAPPQMFELEWKKQQDQQAAAAKTAQMVAQAKLDTAKEIAVDNAKQPNRVALETVKSNNAQDLAVAKGKIDAGNQQNKVKNELTAKVGALKDAGYSDDFIRNSLPDILGLNQYKKATSPEEAKRLAFGDRMKNDPTFVTKTTDQQRQIVDQDMALIYGGLKPGSNSAAGAASAPTTGTTANPFVDGAAPVPNTQAGPATRGLPVLDTRTGKIVYK